MTHKLRTATSAPVAAPPFAIALSISTSPYLHGLKAGTGGVDLSVQRYGDNRSRFKSSRPVAILKSRPHFPDDMQPHFVTAQPFRGTSPKSQSCSMSHPRCRANALERRGAGIAGSNARRAAWANRRRTRPRQRPADREPRSPVRAVQAAVCRRSQGGNAGLDKASGKNARGSHSAPISPLAGSCTIAAKVSEQYTARAVVLLPGQNAEKAA
jgi:hypothetical protein